MKKNSVFFILLFLMVLAVPAKATWYPDENTDIVTVPEGWSEADVLQALYNSRVPEDKMSSKEANKAFKKQCSYNGFCDRINGIAIKVNFGTKMWKEKRRINCRGYNNELDRTKYRVCYPMTTAQEALKPLVENPPPSKYPNVMKLIKYYRKIGVLD